MLIAIAIAEEIQELQTFEILSFLWLWQKVWVVLVWAGVNLCGVFRSGLRSCYFGHGGHDGAWGEYRFMWGTKPKEVLCWVLAPMQSFVILGSLLQWRWQWASIGHFVFLFFSSKFHSKRCSLLLTMKLDFSHQISEIRLHTSILEMS